MADDEEAPTTPAHSENDSLGDINVAEALENLSEEEVMALLRETPGMDEVALEEMRLNGSYRAYFLQTYASGSFNADPESGDEDDPAVAAEAETATENPVPESDHEAKSDKHEPAIATESVNITVVPEATSKVNDDESIPGTSQNFKSEEVPTTPLVPDPQPVTVARGDNGSVAMEVHSPHREAMTPSNEESSPSAKPHRDHHQKKKKKKDKQSHSRKLSTDSSESTKKHHKSKKKHKEKERKADNHVKIKIEPAVKKHKHKLKNAAVIAVDIKEIVLLKKHMVLRQEKLAKIEEIDRFQRLSYHRLKGYVRAVFASTKEKYHKPDKHSSSKPDKSSTKKKEDDMNKKRKRVYCETDDSDSGSDKPKKKRNNSTDKEKEGKHKHKFSASGARIMEFEKKYREQERIRRPKMPEPEPTATPVKKEDKTKAGVGSNQESSRKLQNLLAEAEKAKRRAANQFRIPKARKPGEPEPPTGDLLPPSHTIPLPEPPPYANVSVNVDPSTRFKLEPFRNQPRFGMEYSGFRGRNPTGMHQPRFSRFKVNNMNNLQNERPFDRYDTYNKPVIKPENQPPRKATRLATYDDDNNDMIDLPSDDEEVEIAPPPLTEVKFGESAKLAFRLISRGTALALPDQKGSSTMSGHETVAHKVGWWFQTWDKDPVPWEIPCIPEYDDEKPASDYGDGSVCSSFGNVSNPENTDECQSNEVSSSDQRRTMERNAQNPDIRDEYCGASLLAAKYRIFSESDDTFKNIFELRPGTNYERENLQAKCSICDELIVGKRHLGSHVRSDEHRENLKKLSLNLLGVMTKPPSNTKDKSNEDPSSSTSKRDRENSRQNPPGPNSSKTESKSSKKDEKGGREKNGKGNKEGDIDKMSVTSSRSRVNVMDEIVERVSRSGSHATHAAILSSAAPPVVEESVDRVSRSGSGAGSLPTPPGSMSSSHRGRKSRTKSPPPVRKRNSPPRRRHTKSRSRTRSPRRKHRSRSPEYSRRRGRSPVRPSRRERERTPPRRKTSSERVAEFLEKINPPQRTRSPYGRGTKRRSRSRSPIGTAKVGTRKIGHFPEKLKLQAAGLWTPFMEEQWKAMEAEEAALHVSHQEYKRKLAESPETHPDYAKEWNTWWEMKFVEVDNAGLDATNYNYAPEWKEHWSKRVEILLAAKLNAELDAIQLKYGMDLGTLQRLLLGIPPPPVPVAPIVEQHFGVIIPKAEELILAAPVPAPVPAPSTSEVVAVKATEIYSPFDEDFTARSMSMSSDGSRSQVGEKKPAAKAPAGTPATPSTPVTAQTIQDTWALMTGQKLSSSTSDVGSQRSGLSGLAGPEPDLDGNDIFEVLKLMTNLEDQLGILAPQVKEFAKKAENLESAGAKKSCALLKEKAFVVLLFQCRDKFSKLMTVTVLPREVKKQLNLTLFKLNSILEEDICQKFRPSAQASSPEPESAPTIAKREREPAENTFQLIRRCKDGSGAFVPVASSVGTTKEKKDYQKSLIEGFKSASPAEKIKISSIFTTSLMSQHRGSISNSRLAKYIYEVVEPIIANRRNRDGDSHVPAPSSSISSYSNHSRGSRDGGNGLVEPPLVNSSFRFPEPMSGATRIGVEGIALPKLPEVQCRAASPPGSRGTYLHVQSVPPMVRPRNIRPGGSGGPGPSGYGQSPTRGTPERLHSARLPSKSPRKENRQPDKSSRRSEKSSRHADKRSRHHRDKRSRETDKRSHKKSKSSSSRREGSSRSSSRKDVGVAQEFWNDASSISSGSILGNDIENHGEDPPKRPEPYPRSGGSNAGSITRKSNLRYQSKQKPERERDPEASDPESGEILTDDTLSSISATKRNRDEDDETASQNLERLVAMRGEITKRLKNRNFNSSQNQDASGEGTYSSASDFDYRDPSPKRRARSGRRASRSRSLSRSPGNSRKSRSHTSKRKKSRREMSEASRRKNADQRHRSRKSKSQRDRSSKHRERKSGSRKENSSQRRRESTSPHCRSKSKQRSVQEADLLIAKLRKNETNEIRNKLLRTMEIGSSMSPSSRGSVSPERQAFRIKGSPFDTVARPDHPGLERENGQVVVVIDESPVQNGHENVQDIYVEDIDSTPVQDEGDDDSVIRGIE